MRRKGRLVSTANNLLYLIAGIGTACLLLCGFPWQTQAQTSGGIPGDSITLVGTDNYVFGGCTNCGYNIMIGAGESNQLYGYDSGIIGGLENSSLGNYDFIGGGQENYLNGPASAIVGGFANTNYSQYGFIGGGEENFLPNINNAASGIIAGTYNTNYSSLGFIGGGTMNSEDSYDSASAILGGGGNQISGGANNGIIGGISNIMYYSPFNNFIGAGVSNYLLAASQSGIVAGFSNSITGDTYPNNDNFIGGGVFNYTFDAQFAAIIGGTNNQILSPYHAALGDSIVGGQNNVINDTPFAVLIGGQFNETKGCSGFAPAIVGGTSNLVGAELTDDAVILGGLDNTNYGSSSGILGGSLNFMGFAQSDVGPGPCCNPEPLNCVILGGYSNLIDVQTVGNPSISNSVAGGQLCVLTNNNTFMWNDGGASGTNIAYSGGDGRFEIWAAGGLWLNGTNITGGGCPGGPGTVTSVGMTGDGTLFNTSVSGSPITTSGTLAPSLKTQNANTVFAGPPSGSPAAPTFQSAPTFDGANLTSLTAANISPGTAAINISGNAATATSATSAVNFSGTLSGDVTGTQSATVVTSVGSAALPAAQLTGTWVNASLSNASNSGALNLTGLAPWLINAGPSGGNSLIMADESGNFYSGLNAGELPAGLYNTGVGDSALTDITGGYYNTAVGFCAMQSDDAGHENTALGTLALGGSVEGNNNIAIGYQAGANVISNNNIEIGSEGLSTDNGVINIGTPGTHTVANIAGVIYGNGAGLTNLKAASVAGVITNNNIGGVTLNSLTVSGTNVSEYFSGSGGGLSNLLAAQLTGTWVNASLSNAANFGPFSLKGAEPWVINCGTSGGFSLIVDDGSQSFYAGANAGNADSGDGNTGVGNEALQDIAGGSYNTAIGYQAMGVDDYGYYNTAVGYNALGYAVYGSNNIAIGSQAGVNVISNNNIEIGNEGLSTDSGVINIGTPGIHTVANIAGVISGNGGGLTNVAGSGIVESVYTTTASFTLTPTNSVVLLSGSATVTLPSAAGVAGKTYTIKDISSSSTTVYTTSSQKIDGSTTYALSQYKFIKVVSDGTQWWNIGNN